MTAVTIIIMAVPPTARWSNRSSTKLLCWSDSTFSACLTGVLDEDPIVSVFDVLVDLSENIGELCSQ